MNEIIFTFHVVFIAAGSLFALFLGKEALACFIGLLGILSNLFVTKQIVLFGLTVTSSDAFAVGGILGLNLMQEYFGKQAAEKTIRLSLVIMLFYLLATLIHVWYAPAPADIMHPHFVKIFELMPRITISSLYVYFLVQSLDAHLYGFLHKIFQGKYLIARSATSLIISQCIDTALFSLLALYGVVESIIHIMIVSLIIKLVVIALSVPFIAWSKKIITPQPSSRAS
jgi:hypothetical protein